MNYITQVFSHYLPTLAFNWSSFLGDIQLIRTTLMLQCSPFVSGWIHSHLKVCLGYSQVRSQLIVPWWTMSVILRQGDASLPYTWVELYKHDGQQLFTIDSSYFLSRLIVQSIDPMPSINQLIVSALHVTDRRMDKWMNRTQSYPKPSPLMKSPSQEKFDTEHLCVRLLATLDLLWERKREGGVNRPGRLVSWRTGMLQ